MQRPNQFFPRRSVPAEQPVPQSHGDFGCTAEIGGNPVIDNEDAAILKWFINTKENRDEKDKRTFGVSGQYSEHRL